LEEHINELDFRKLPSTKNPCVIDFLEKHSNRIINPEKLCGVESVQAVKLLEPFVKKDDPDIDWCALSENPYALDILAKNVDKIDWYWIAHNSNSNTVILLKENMGEINWKQVSAHGNKSMMNLLESNPDKIDWNKLSMNPDAIHLLKRNQDKIDWRWFTLNEAIFL
jgi:hypothetical protein